MSIKPLWTVNLSKRCIFIVIIAFVLMKGPIEFILVIYYLVILSLYKAELWVWEPKFIYMAEHSNQSLWALSKMSGNSDTLHRIDFSPLLLSTFYIDYLLSPALHYISHLFPWFILCSAFFKWGRQPKWKAWLGQERKSRIHTTVSWPQIQFISVSWNTFPAC